MIHIIWDVKPITSKILIPRKEAFIFHHLTNLKLSMMRHILLSHLRFMLLERKAINISINVSTTRYYL